MSRIFISHSKHNNAHALAMGQWLEANGFKDYFLDIHQDRGLVVGTRWIAALVAGVNRCEAVLFLLSPEWTASHNCHVELWKAHELGKRMFGVIIGEPTQLDKLPPQLQTWQVCKLTSPDDAISFEVDCPGFVSRCTVQFSSSGLARLLRGLKAAGLDPATFVWPPESEPKRSPYPGLRAFDELDAAVFFGRESSIIRALDQLYRAHDCDTEQLYVIVGASGAGKSSFLRAGLLPRLRRDSRHFVVLPILRCEHAAMAGHSGLLGTLRTALECAGIDRSVAQVRDALQAKGLADLLRTIESAGAPAASEGPRFSRTVIIPIDQAEELFTTDNEAGVLLKHFKTALDESKANAKSRAPDRLRIMLLLTVRADSLAALQRHETFAEYTPTLFSLPAMPVANFRSVIEGPASRHSKPINIEPDLVEELIRDTGGADALPLLALTLELLYHECTTCDGTRLGIKEYQIIGGVAGVINAAVRRAFDQPQDAPAIPPEGEARDKALADIFTQIATIDPDTRLAKRRIALRSSLHACGPVAQGIVSRLIKERLLSSYATDAEGGGKSEVIEVAHEALLRHWDVLARWLRTQAADLATFETMRRAAIEWDRSDHDPALLVHTAHRLKAAESLQADPQLARRLEQVDAQYLAACRARDDREFQDREDRLKARARNQRRFSIVVAASALVVVALLIGTVVQRREVGRQTSLVLAAASERASDENQFTQAVRLGILATKSDILNPMDPTAAPSLSRAADGNRLTLMVRHPGVLAAVFNLNGTRIVTGSSNGTVLIWNATTGELLREIKHSQQNVHGMAFSPDGTRVVMISHDTARLLDVVAGRPIGNPLKHPGVYSAAFSTNGMRIVTVSRAGARIWDASTGGQIGHLIRNPKRPRRIRVNVSSDGSHIVMVDLDRTARVLDADTGKQVGGILVSVNSVTFSPDSKRIVTISGGRGVLIRDVATGKLLVPIAGIPAFPAVRRAAFSPDGERIIILSEDTAYVADASIGIPLFKIGNQKFIRYASFSPDRTRIVTVSGDTARIWDAATGRGLGKPMRHDGDVSSLEFSPDSKRIVTVSGDVIRVWNVSEHEVHLASVAADEPSWFNSVLHSAPFSADGTRVLTVSMDQVSKNSTVHVWDATNGKLVAASIIHDSDIDSVTFSPNGTRIVMVSENGIRILDPTTGKQLGKLYRGVNGAASSLDGRRIITVSDDTASVWDATSGKRLGELHGVHSATFSPDGTRIVTISDNTVRVWDANSRNPVGVSLTHDSDVDSATFSPDGTRIVTISDDGLRIWDASSGISVSIKDDSNFESAMVSPDGTRIVTVSWDDTTRIWDATSRKRLGEIHRGVSSTLNPSGTRIVTVSDDTARIWDTTTGNPVGQPMNPDGSGNFNGAAFSPDGTRVVTASDDGTARLWDAATGKPLGEPMLHDAAVNAATFSPDGTRVVTASDDGTVVFWAAKWSALAATPAKLIAAACASMNKEARRVTQADREKAKLIPAYVDDVCKDTVFNEP